MKKKVSAIVLAISLAAASVHGQAKQQTSRSSDNSQKLEKRLANTLRRINRKKAEQEFIRETECEITQALSNNIKATNIQENTKNLKAPVVFHHDTLPTIGIDISNEFKTLYESEAG